MKIWSNTTKVPTHSIHNSWSVIYLGKPVVCFYSTRLRNTYIQENGIKMFFRRLAAYATKSAAPKR